MAGELRPPNQARIAVLKAKYNALQGVSLPLAKLLAHQFHHLERVIRKFQPPGLSPAEQRQIDAIILAGDPTANANLPELINELEEAKEQPTGDAGTAGTP